MLTSVWVAPARVRALTHPAKVDRAFDLGADTGGIGMVESQENQNLRHRLWIKRSRSGPQASWRPHKRYRVATNRWLACLDNQARQSCHPTDGRGS